MVDATGVLVILSKRASERLRARLYDGVELEAIDLAVARSVEKAFVTERVAL